ncbi:MAG: hypothetical protein HC827_00970 [Cyanobacteria bacterium RM1_2_2]|nr:hypothetical protein [Cyanobacteria bacterium RM1_2_2]
MTYKHMNRLVATVAGLLGSAAFVTLTSLPGIAQSMNSQEGAPETRDSGPTTVPGEGFPGPGEPPSGRPSVPDTFEGESNENSSDRESRPSVERDAMNSPDSSTQDQGGPSAVPSQSFPGPGETPSGSPSVPGISVYDNPNYESDRESDMESMSPEQGSPSDSRPEGPSAVPGQGVPGPGETPSGSPSVDDPNLEN